MRSEIEMDVDREVAEGWDAVAAAWDRFVDTGDEPTTEPTLRMIDLLAVQPGDALLELAAGPGSWPRSGPIGSAPTVASS